MQAIIPRLISQVENDYLNVEISDGELRGTLLGVRFALSWFT